MGAPGHPREVRVAFWDGIRAGLGVEEAAAGAGRHAARAWMRQAGGVKGNGEAALSGRYLQAREREEIAGLAQGLAYREIAGRLAPGRSAPTVSRGAAGNSVHGRYRAHLAAREARQRARRPEPAKLAACGELREWVQEKLKKKWSPEEISRRLELEFPDRAEMRVPPETIYQSLYVQGRGALRRELAAHLRTGRSLRRPRRAEGERRGRLPGMVSIAARPPEADDRAVPGHWEGDQIAGTAFGLELVIFAGTTLDLFACPGLAAEFGVPEGGTPPEAPAVGLLQAGTMRWKATAIGGYHDGENTLCDRLEGALGPGQLSLADRGFFSMDRWQRFSGTGAHLLWRVKNTTRAIPFRHVRTLKDGSELVLLRESSGILGKRRRETGDRRLALLFVEPPARVKTTSAARTGWPRFQVADVGLVLASSIAQALP